MDQFLQILADPSDNERRRFERISPKDLHVSIVNGERKGRRLQVVDISRGGLSLGTDWSPAPGDLVTLAFAVLNDPVTARVVHSENGHLGLGFVQDRGNIALVDRVLATISAKAAA